MANVLQVTHASLSEAIAFDEDEVAHLDVIPRQPSFRQFSQANILTVVYAGTERLDLEVVFIIKSRATLTKLDAVRALQETFQVRPFLLEGVDELDVLWEGSDYREQWIRGRSEAGWELTVTWEEALTGTCL